MDNPHRFILEPYKGPATRFVCPQCGKAKELTRYIDLETGERLPEHVGKCNRSSSCGYHYPPRDYFSDGGERPRCGNTVVRIEPPARPPFLHTRDEVQALRRSTIQNSLSAFWRPFLGADKWDEVCRLYALGTWPNGPMAGAAVYWQVDMHGNVKAGKVMLYDANTGRRSKDGGATSFVHFLTTGRYADDLNVEQCLFGEHLLRDWPADKPVAIVESEKTAMLCAALAPAFRWVAVGARDTFTLRRLQPLTGRHVVAYPDLGKDKTLPSGKLDPRAFVRWTQKAEEFGHLFASIRVSNLLEVNATDSDRDAGLDIADLLLRPVPSHASEKVTACMAHNACEEYPGPPTSFRILSEAEDLAKRMIDRNPAVGSLVDELNLDLSAARVVPLSTEALDSQTQTTSWKRRA